MPNYCPPKEFREEIIKSLEQDELTEQAVTYLYAIAVESSKKLSYKDFQDRDDCIMAAMEDVLKYWRSYNPEKSSNAFAYYTQIIKHGFAKGWRELHPLKETQKVYISDENIHIG
jgi:DNA-directed RNA polymerase specialized sigma subunit